jgi:MFS transporter, ACS family, hexuronate transporter
VIARFFGDPVWWLYLIWLPLYLHNARGFSLKSIGLSAWIPYVAADAGALLGGWTSGYLVGRGWTARRARGAAIVFATLLAPVGMLVGRVSSPVSAMALISVVLFAFQFWVNNVQTLPSDLFSPSLVASISGLAGTGAGVGAMIFTFSTGWVVDHLGYAPILIASGLLVPIGTILLFWLLRPARPAHVVPI